MSTHKVNKFQNSMKKWTYVPGKVIPMIPLNLQEIKKQLLESSSEESEELEETPSDTLSQGGCTSIKELSNLRSLDTAIIEDNLPLNYENSHKAIMDSENKENILPNIKTKDKNINESFDLDLSTLSLNTPFKKIHTNFTPKINIISSSETKSTFLKKSLNTPIISNASAQKYYGTPLSTIKPLLPGSQKSISPIYMGTDGFNKILVNNFEYTIHNLIGRGGTSEVYCGFNPVEELYVAIKLVSLSDSSTAETYKNEVKLLESLKNCNKIIKMYEYEIRNEKLIVVLEKGGEDLSTILKQLATKQLHLPNYMILFYWMEMLYAVKEIHTNGIIHSDLKPGNFLRIGTGLKLIDFGIANKVQENMTCVYKTCQEGSCNYISPEALNLQTSTNENSPSYGKSKYKIHFKSDVWSLGCILYQLVYQKTPFYQIEKIWARLAAIMNPNHKISYPEAECASPTIIKTLKKCLQYDVNLRPSVDELIEEYEDILKNI